MMFHRSWPLGITHNAVVKTPKQRQNPLDHCKQASIYFSVAVAGK